MKINKKCPKCDSEDVKLIPKELNSLNKFYCQDCQWEFNE